MIPSKEVLDIFDQGYAICDKALSIIIFQGNAVFTNDSLYSTREITKISYLLSMSNIIIDISYYYIYDSLYSTR